MKPWMVWFIVAISFAYLPDVAAAPFSPDLTEALNSGFQALFDILQQEYAVFGITIIVMFILFRNIFLAGISKVPHLADSPYSGGIAGSFSLLSVLGIVYLKIESGKNVSGLLRDLLGPYGLYAAIFVCVMLYLWLHHSLQGRKTALFVSGLIGYTFGMMIGSGTLSAIAGLIALIGLLLWIFSGNQGYSQYNGANPASPSRSGMFGSSGNKEKRRAKDSVTLVKDQLASLKREEKIADELFKLDEDVNKLEMMRQRLESDERVDFNKESEILEELLDTYSRIQDIDKQLDLEERHYQASGSTEAARKIAYLKDRRQRFVELYKQLTARLKVIADDETRLLKKDLQLIEAEEKEVEQQYRDTGKLIAQGQQVMKDEKELENDVSEEQVLHELQMENQVKEEEKIAERLMGEFDTEVRILERIRNINLILLTNQHIIGETLPPENIREALSQIRRFTEEKRVLEAKLAKLRPEERKQEEREIENIKTTENVKKGDLIKVTR